MMEYPTKSYDQLTDKQKVKVDKEKESWQQLNEYYDSLLPKSGGGLWNELIVFFYLLQICLNAHSYTHSAPNTQSG